MWIASYDEIIPHTGGSVKGIVVLLLFYVCRYSPYGDGLDKDGEESWMMEVLLLFYVCRYSLNRYPSNSVFWKQRCYDGDI